MCKTHHNHRRMDLAGQSHSGEQPYEGATIKLRNGAGQRRSHGACHWWGIQWWGIWLIWPLVSLIKTVAPTVVTCIATVAQWSVPLLPLVLIALGLLLLWRR